MHYSSCYIQTNIREAIFKPKLQMVFIMNKLLSLTLISVLAITESGYTQENQDSRIGTISGKVHDSSSRAPLEYANVVLYSAKDSALVTGAVTNPNGNFQISEIATGDYYLVISFMGYESERISDINIMPPKLDLQLGTVSLEPTTLSAEGVVVEGERAAVSYQIDKKVIDVSQQHTAISGTAIDVLENVPSISVDIEGNVSLRGSGSFTVLIDGRPTILQPSEALQQIPSSNIENIEIITNPSAKYNPEGTAGIINVILKKNRQSGTSTVANANAGLNDKYGGDLLVENKTPRYHATLGFDNRNYFFSGDQREENQTTFSGTTSFINSNGDSRRGWNGHGLRAGIEFRLGPKNLLSLGGRYRDRNRKSNSDLNYNEWSSLDAPLLRQAQQPLRQAQQPLRQAQQLLSYTSTAHSERSGDSYELNLSYQHLFNKDGHELSGDFSFEQGDSFEETTNELLNEMQTLIEGKRTTEAGPDKEFQVKLDYALPFNDDHKFDAGYQSDLDHSDDNTGLHEYDPALQTYVVRPQFSNSTNYQNDEHALYAIYAGAWKKLGFQGGLRGEYTDRTIKFQQQTFKIDRWDYFPTFHASYEFSDGRQFMASYTRRIERPGGGELEPFLTWTDAYNVRTGNPSLKPEFIDSYEAGIQTFFGKALFSIETYYRVNHNKIDDVRSVYAKNVTLHSAANIGTDNALGSELLLDFDLFKNWGVNLTGNVYRYRIEGALSGEAFSRKSNNWSARLNNVIKIGESTQIQINGRYNSPTVSSQGRREGSFVADLALKQEFFNDSFSATLQVRDLLRTSKDEHVSRGVGFYNYRYSTRESPVVMLNLRYSYNQQREERERENRENGEDENED